MMMIDESQGMDPGFYTLRKDSETILARVDELRKRAPVATDLSELKKLNDELAKIADKMETILSLKERRPR